MEVGTEDLIVRADEDKNRFIAGERRGFYTIRTLRVEIDILMSTVSSPESHDGYVPP